MILFSVSIPVELSILPPEPPASFCKTVALNLVQTPLLPDVSHCGSFLTTHLSPCTCLTRCPQCSWSDLSKMHAELCLQLSMFLYHFVGEVQTSLVIVPLPVCFPPMPGLTLPKSADPAAPKHACQVFPPSLHPMLLHLLCLENILFLLQSSSQVSPCP